MTTRVHLRLLRFLRVGLTQRPLFLSHWGTSADRRRNSLKSLAKQVKKLKKQVSSVQRQQGPTGAQGAQGAPGTNAFGSLRYVSATASVTGAAYGSANCPADEHVVGGGEMSIGGDLVQMVHSAPTDGDDADTIRDDGWIVRVSNTGLPGTPIEFTTYAICAPAGSVS